MSDNALAKRLLKMKQQIEDADSQARQHNARLASLMEQLEEGFGCKNLRQAQTLLRQLNKEAADLQKKVQQGIEHLEEKLNG